MWICKRNIDENLNLFCYCRLAMERGILRFLHFHFFFLSYFIFADVIVLQYKNVLIRSIFDQTWYSQLYNTVSNPQPRVIWYSDINLEKKSYIKKASPTEFSLFFIFTEEDSFRVLRTKRRKVAKTLFPWTSNLRRVVTKYGAVQSISKYS